MAVAALRTVEVDEPVAVGVVDAPTKVMVAQSDDLGVIVVKAKVVVVIAPRLVLFLTPSILLLLLLLAVLVLFAKTVVPKSVTGS